MVDTGFSTLALRSKLNMGLELVNFPKHKLQFSIKLPRNIYSGILKMNSPSMRNIFNIIYSRVCLCQLFSRAMINCRELTNTKITNKNFEDSAEKRSNFYFVPGSPPTDQLQWTMRRKNNGVWMWTNKTLIVLVCLLLEKRLFSENWIEKMTVIG